MERKNKNPRKSIQWSGLWLPGQRIFFSGCFFLDNFESSIEKRLLFSFLFWLWRWTRRKTTNKKPQTNYCLFFRFQNLVSLVGLFIKLFFRILVFQCWFLIPDSRFWMMIFFLILGFVVICPWTKKKLHHFQIFILIKLMKTTGINYRWKFN